jgi:hypothetical protein
VIDVICTGLTIYTPGWLAEHDPSAPPGYSCYAELDELPAHGPVAVPGHLLAEYIAAIAPPTVTLRFAHGEDIVALKGLVELATAGGTLH